MNTIKSVLLAVVCALVFGEAAAMAEPVDTGFTYQGQVKKGTALLDGPADFEFTLWDEVGSDDDPPVGGTQIGPMMAMTLDGEEELVNGLFTVKLDFGADVFTGEKRWLQVRVCPPAGGSGSDCTTLKRQELAGTPYAQYALGGAGSGGCLWELSGSDISYEAGKVGIGIAIPDTALHVVGDDNTGLTASVKIDSGE